MKKRAKPWEVKSAVLRAEQNRNRAAVDAMTALALRVGHLEVALREARDALACLTEQVRTIAPQSPHAAMLARIDAVLANPSHPKFP